MTDLEKAKELLIDNKTCILVKDEMVITSELRGIMPVLNLLDTHTDLEGYSVADRIVGKAAALLFAYAGIKEAYGEVMSVAGMKVLEEFHIPYSYKTKTEKIINRAGDDICPMEKTVIDIDNPEDAYIALKKKVESLRK